MAEETGDTRVVINHRTLRIGRENYALNNIARVQVIGVKPPPDAGQGNAKLGCMSAFGVFLLFSILTASTQSGALATIGFVAAIAVGILVFIKSKKAYTPRYALMLESTGNPKAGLISPDRESLEWVSDRIVDAIENPPETEQSYTVSNVFLGDQFNQYGDGNIGRMVNP
ncbi:DUF6232 family protein [Amycolatopsis sp. NPDC088138]|uniref:DUF6232 family protein n=1 Tax=Amycolatopsis sp. NPDC088138 TaxID=3363938 RepID=UPI00381A9FB0